MANFSYSPYSHLIKKFLKTLTKVNLKKGYIKKYILTLKYKYSDYKKEKLRNVKPFADMVEKFVATYNEISLCTYIK